MTENPPAKEEKGKEVKKEEKKKPQSIYVDFKKFLKLLAGAVKRKEIKAVGILMKTIGAYRKAFTLNDAIELSVLLPFAQVKVIPEALSVKYQLSESRLKSFQDIPEVEGVVRLILVMKLLDSKKYKDALVESTKLIEAIKGLDKSMNKLSSGDVAFLNKDKNRRTLDYINAKAYFFYARSAEVNQLLTAKRSELYAAYRLACLRLDRISQATLLNILLRSYINDNDYELARNLISKTTFPEDVSIHQYARYLYYLGRIKAVQLEYAEAERILVQALRKAPSQGAKGFRLQIIMLKSIVELLTGAIPESSVFFVGDLRKYLTPYFKVVQAVRGGNLKTFEEVIAKYSFQFIADKNYSMIQRLRHNVIKFGLRKIFLSYSRISLKDICLKLNLESVEETEYIVAKAIRDGVIDAIINHENQFLQMRQTVDIYSTNEPQNVFTRRIEFCLGLYNDAVKALEFPKKEEKSEKVPDKTDNGAVEDIVDLLGGDFD